MRFQAEVGIGFVAQHVGAEPREELRHPFGVEHLAGGRAVAIDDMRAALHADADGAARFGRRPLGFVELAVEAEMDVQRVAAGEAVEEMLAVGLDAGAAAPVERRRAVEKAPLRRRDGQNLALQHRDLVARLAMDRMAFGHAAVSRTKRRGLSKARGLNRPRDAAGAAQPARTDVTKRCDSLRRRSAWRARSVAADMTLLAAPPVVTAPSVTLSSFARDLGRGAGGSVCTLDHGAGRVALYVAGEDDLGGHPRHLADRVTDLPDGIDRAAGGALDALDLAADVVGRAGGLVGEALDLRGDDGETAPGLAGPAPPRSSR